MINDTQPKRDWQAQKGKLLEQFAMLKDKDLMFEGGKKDEMLVKLQIRLGKTKEQLRQLIASL